ncbi:MAG: SsrA-binding protein SmpB [Chloroflexi bacterium]|nr:SsrA-binding protein SmpB [Chloroflexota bacterium]
MKIIAVNRKARHDYDILETIEGGLVLTGTEIKSIRNGRANIRDAFARPEGGELWLYNAHIAQYASGNRYNHEPTRPRKLLLHRDQIDRLIGKVQEKGLSLVPLKLYIKDHRAKIELALARGRKLYDKRRSIAEKDAERQMQRMTRKTIGRRV